MKTALNKLKQYIDDHYNGLSNLGYSEVEEHSVNDFDQDIVDYLKMHYRFDYKDVCIYYVSEENEIWIELMS